MGLKANYKRGGVSRYKKVGSEQFNCSSCGRDKPLRERYGTICYACRHKRRVCTIEGALRYRFNKKKSHAKHKGIPFTLTFEEYKRQYEKQDGKDGYTGKQLCFEFGHGRSRTTGSLDKIDNEGGYSPGNIMFCSLAINAKKGTKPVERLMVQLELSFASGQSEDSQPKTTEESNTEDKL